MSRGVLIVIVLVLLLAIAGVGLALFWQPNILNRNTNEAPANTATSNLNSPPAINQAVSNTNLPGFSGFQAETIKKSQLDERTTYRGSDVPIDRAEFLDGYTGYEAAPEGKKYLVVYFEREAFKHELPIDQWLREIQLLDSSGNVYSFDRAEFPAGNLLEKREPYVSFEVDENLTGFKLRIVRPEEDVIVDLGL